jgi:ribosomal protein L40E
MCFRQTKVLKGKKVCPACQGDNPPVAVVCTKCGAALTGQPDKSGTSGPGAPGPSGPIAGAPGTGAPGSPGPIAGAPGRPMGLGGKKCPSCLTLNPTSALKCSKCGAPLPGFGGPPPTPK